MKHYILSILSNLRRISGRDLMLFLVVFALCLSLDLYTKTIVFSADFSVLKICNILNIVKVENYGISFGLFASSTIFIKKLIVIFNIVVCLCLFYLLSSKSNYRKPNVFLVAISMIISGAIGNVYDRIKFGYVRDFIDCHIFDKHWPAFNVADSCICIGVGLWIILEILTNKTFNKQK